MLNMRMSVSVTETQPLSHYSPVSLRLLIHHLLIGRGKSWAVFAQVHSHDGEICGFLTVRRRGQTLQRTPGVDGDLSALRRQEARSATSRSSHSSLERRYEPYYGEGVAHEY